MHVVAGYIYMYLYVHIWLSLIWSPSLSKLLIRTVFFYPLYNVFYVTSDDQSATYTPHPLLVKKRTHQYCSKFCNTDLRISSFSPCIFFCSLHMAKLYQGLFLPSSIVVNFADTSFFSF